jgi:hypothetical protein
MRQLYLLFLFLHLWLKGSAHGEIIQDTVEVIFKPTNIEALVVFESGEVLWEDAVFFESQTKMPSTGGKVFVVGAKVDEDRGPVAVVSWRLIGEGGADFSTPFQQVKEAGRITRSGSNLKGEILSRRGALKELRSELGRDVYNLKRLRVEAGRKADLGKIIQIEEDTRRINDETEAIARDIKNLQDSLEIVKEMREPLRFEKRKVTLTEQLSELAKVALAAEQTASSRKKSSEIELEQKLSLIDSTRFDDLDELEAEYRSVTGSDFSISETSPQLEQPVSASDYIAEDTL